MDKQIQIEMLKAQKELMIRQLDYNLAQLDDQIKKLNA